MTGTPSLTGTALPGYETVADAFADALSDDGLSGAALAIRVGGELVVDLAGGIADGRSGRVWDVTTPSVIFSSTKGLVAILVARLVQEGRLDYEAPVADYWPEFGAAGKSEVKVRHLVTHQSGLSAPREVVELEDVLDWERITSSLARQEPLWTPGEGYQYHALTYGWLAGEVIRRVTGSTVGHYFRTLISGPLEVDAWIGLPSEVESRVAHLTVGPSLRDLIEAGAAERDPAVTDWPDRAMTLGNAFPSSLVSDEGGFNDPRVHAAEIPGAGGIATARALATIWAATVAPGSATPLLDPDTIALATRVQTEGTPVFGGIGPFPRWGMGFQLNSPPVREFLGEESFGHDGAGGQVAFGDHRHGVGFAFLTNRMEAGGDSRATDILHALRAVL